MTMARNKGTGATVLLRCGIQCLRLVKRAPHRDSDKKKPGLALMSLCRKQVLLFI